MDGICGLLADRNPLVPPYDTKCRKHHWNFPNSLARRNRRRMAAGSGRALLLEGCARLAVVLLTLFVLCLVALLVLFLTDPTIIDTKFANVTAADRDGLRFVEVQKLCRNITGAATIHCCAVVDTVDRQRDTVRRAMFFDLAGDSFESEVPLIPPMGASLDNSDTRLWRVDHATLLNEYVCAMALMPFLVGSLDHQSSGGNSGSTTASALIIGLGGGSLDMFLHTKFPGIDITVYETESMVIELAERWFGVVNDRRRRTVLGDGLIAIDRYANNQSARFDAIIVDACGGGEKLSCPAPQFITLPALRLVKSALKPLGAFVLNVLPANEQDEESEIARLQQRLLSYFPLCVRIRMGRQLNSVFTCLPYSFDANDLDTIRAFWQQKTDILVKQFGFQGRLEGSRLAVGLAGAN